MSVNSYEIVDPNTGEMIDFETSIDIGLIQEYNSWVVDNKIHPPQFTPVEYAKHIENQNIKIANVKAIEMIERYNMGTAWEPEMIDSLLRILRNEE